MTDAHLWTGGRVFTGRRYVEALLVEDGRVVAAGPRDRVLAQAATGTDRTDLAGALLIPGLIDAHLHLSELARHRIGLDVSAVTTEDELVDRLTAWAAEHPSGPIAGHGWDPEGWTGHRWVDRTVVDRAIRDRPVVLEHGSGHAALLNSLALDSVGLDPARPAPRDPTIGCGGDGRPNGLLFEEALRPVRPLIDAALPIGPAELSRTLFELAGWGLTMVASMGPPPSEPPALRDLATAGPLPVSVRLYLRAARRGGFRPGPLGAPDSRCSVVGIKEFMDGAFGTRTAWLSAPYADSPATSGVPVGDDAELSAVLEETSREGWAPALHAIGDRAVARALRLLRPTRGRTLAPGRIEHASLTPMELMADLAEVRPTLVVQPGFVASDHWLGARLGPARARWAYAFRTLTSRGLLLAGSSDAPFDPVDPWHGIRVAVHRRNETGGSANPSGAEVLSIEEAVGLYTSGAAAALGEPDRGRLEPGAIADLTVLSVPDLAAALSARANPVRATWVEGRPVAGAGR